jgi:hypothetical protein
MSMTVATETDTTHFAVALAAKEDGCGVDFRSKWKNGGSRCELTFLGRPFVHNLVSYSSATCFLFSTSIYEFATIEQCREYSEHMNPTTIQVTPGRLIVQCGVVFGGYSEILPALWFSKAPDESQKLLLAIYEAKCIRQ